jgi:hypothetical protein
MTSYACPDESFNRLHRASWSVGETGTAGTQRPLESCGKGRRTEELT